nr:hypothetical protein CFP56_21055 [Quercus suber]
MTRGVTDDIASSAQLPLHTRPQETFCTTDIKLAALADLVLNLLSPPIGASLDSNQRLQPGRGAFNVALGEDAAAPVEAQERAFSQPRSGETGVLVDESVHFPVAHA